MMTVWASIQGVAFGVCTERDWSNWIMQWGIRLLTVVVAMRGPLFVSVFNPMVLVMVANAGSLLLEEKMHLGMLLGSILIVGGLYVVLWGKGNELKKLSEWVLPESEISRRSESHNSKKSGCGRGSSGQL
ncbi:hypothetical protein OROMI_002017 [Orobanche minor]